MISLPTGSVFHLWKAGSNLGGDGKNISDTDYQHSDRHANRRLPPAPQYSCHPIFLPVEPRNTRSPFFPEARINTSSSPFYPPQPPRIP